MCVCFGFLSYHVIVVIFYSSPLCTYGTRRVIVSIEMPLPHVFERFDVMGNGYSMCFSRI